jgi:hypothetical protein
MRYRPRPIAADVLVFRPETHFEGYSDPTLGWTKYVTGHLEVVTIPVNPGGMLIEPYIGILGRVMNARLQAATEVSPKPR